MPSTREFDRRRDSVSQPVNILASQKYPDIEVKAVSRSGVGVVNIARLTNDKKAQTVRDTPSVIGTLAVKPAANVTQCIGTQLSGASTAWLMISVNTDGSVRLWHHYGEGKMTWSMFEGSVAFPIA